MRRGRHAGSAAAAAAAAILVVAPARAQDEGLDGVGHLLGSEEATLTVVEFGDFACSACALFHEATWPTIRREFVETGRVLWRHVPFVLGFDRGKEATRAAECAADQGAYWEMHDVLFARQDEWTESEELDDTLFGYATEIGLDGGRFEECIDEDYGEERTKRANEAAKDLKVRATPTFFIEGFRVQGALSVEAFRALLEDPSAPGSP
jgi:protein-disulfide isomerase